MSCWDDSTIDQHTLECGVRIGRLPRDDGFHPVLVLLDAPGITDPQIDLQSKGDSRRLLKHLKSNGASEQDIRTVLEMVKQVEAEL